MSRHTDALCAAPACCQGVLAAGAERSGAVPQAGKADVVTHNAMKSRCHVQCVLKCPVACLEDTHAHQKYTNTEIQIHTET